MSGWPRELRGAGREWLNELSVDNDGAVWLSGNFTNGIDLGSCKHSYEGRGEFLAKLDVVGKTVLSTILADPVDVGVATISFDDAGDVYVTGFAAAAVQMPGGTMVTPRGKSDAFAARLSPDGQLRWAKTFGASDASADAIGVIANGALYLTGRYTGALDFGPAGTLREPPPPPAVPMLSNGRSFYVAKLSLEGEPVWARTFSAPVPVTSGDLRVGAIGADASGNVVVLGSYRTSEGADAGTAQCDYLPSLFLRLGEITTADPNLSLAALRKYDPAGELLWTETSDWPGRVSPYTG